MPFLSRSEEAFIKEKIEARWLREAAAVAMEATSVSSTEEPAPAQPAVVAARDGTTLESLGEEERNMILHARTKVRLFP